MKPTVVVGYDRSPSSERALGQAGREAAWRDADLTVVNAFHWAALTTPVAYIPANVETSLKEAADEVAASGAQWLRLQYPGMTVRSAALAGATADGLAEAARHAELLVLGSRGRGGFTGLLLGSVSMRALTLASCPTMIVRGTPGEPVDTVLVALDAEDPSEEVIEFAFAEAELRAARLKAVSVCELDRPGAADPGTAEDFDTAEKHALADLRTTLETTLTPVHARHPDVHLIVEIAPGAPSAVLTDLSRDVDLIVAGAHRRGDGRVGMRPGPVVHTLLHHADCPVVVVPRA